MTKNYLRLEEFRGRRKRRKKNSGEPTRGPESLLQERCVNWFRVEYPEYGKLLFSIPNGGFRTATIGAIMKKEGMTKGVPDLLLLIPSGNFHGLAIEFKVEKRALSKEQLEWAIQVRKQGYRFEVVRFFEVFKSLIQGYFI